MPNGLSPAGYASVLTRIIKMAELKAINTLYNGYLFRSRLEARWAVFFDAAGIKYEYEPEGFELPSGDRYLPDFYLPEQEMFVEVKGPVLTDYDKQRIEEFRHNLNRDDDNRPARGLLILREIPTHVKVMLWQIQPAWEHDGTGALGWDGPYLFCVCPICGRVGIEIEGAGADVCPHGYTDRPSRNPSHPKLLAAYQRARAARFEHGETPKPIRSFDSIRAL